MNMIADLLFVAIVTGVSAGIAFAGGVRAGILLVTSVFSGLLAMNWFEPLSNVLIGFVGETSSLAVYCDFVSLLVVFLVTFVLLLVIISRIMPNVPELPLAIDLPIRWLFAVSAGCVIAAFLFAAVHAFPASRDFGGYFPPEPDRRAGPLMQLAPDYQWLKFTAHVSRDVFPIPGQKSEFAKPKLSNTHSFPGRYALWREQFGTGEQSGRPPE